MANKPESTLKRLKILLGLQNTEEKPFIPSPSPRHLIGGLEIDQEGFDKALTHHTTKLATGTTPKEFNDMWQDDKPEA